MVSGRTKAHELERLLPWTWKAERLAAAINAWVDSGARCNGLSEADPDVLAKLAEQRLERGQEAEALPGRQVVGEDDLL